MPLESGGSLDNRYCIQVFLNDVNEELWAGAGAAPLPNSYRGVPARPDRNAGGGFFVRRGIKLHLRRADQYPNGIRETSGSNRWRNQRRQHEPDGPEWDHRLFLYAQE